MRQVKCCFYITIHFLWLTVLYHISNLSNRADLESSEVIKEISLKKILPSNRPAFFPGNIKASHESLFSKPHDQGAIFIAVTEIRKVSFLSKFPKSSRILVKAHVYFPPHLFMLCIEYTKGES